MFCSRVALIAAVIAVLPGLGACASTPKYGPADSVDGYGHYSSKLEQNRYRIVYNGRPSTGPTTTRDYALLHAAELTLREGHDWFEVVDREMAASQTSQPSAGFTYDRGYYVERSCGLLACTRSTYPMTGGRMQVDSGRSQTKYSYVLEIVMGKGEMPEKGGNYYAAAAIASSLIASL
jgi:hypothetical protein